MSQASRNGPEDEHVAVAGEETQRLLQSVTRDMGRLVTEQLAPGLYLGAPPIETLAEIGVEMTISNLPSAVMFGDFWALSQFDTAISGITYLIGADPDVTNRFHTKSIAAQGGRGSNNAQYSNAEVDALLEEGSRTFDPEARREIYFRIQEIIRRDLPFLPLFANTSVFGHKGSVGGFIPTSNTRTESWNAAAWYWKS